MGKFIAVASEPVPSALAWLILGMAGIFLYVVLSLGF